MNRDNRPDDCIHLEGLEVLAQVGVAEEERASVQHLIFNITFWPAHPMTPLGDDLTRTVDYAAVCAETKRFVSARADKLIETLADALAMRLLEMFAIEKLTIELRKFILPEVEFVSVTVTREKLTTTNGPSYAKASARQARMNTN